MKNNVVKIYLFINYQLITAFNSIAVVKKCNCKLVDTTTLIYNFKSSTVFIQTVSVTVCMHPLFTLEAQNSTSTATSLFQKNLLNYFSIRDHMLLKSIVQCQKLLYITK